VSYCRFIDDPAQIAELEGQRYIVLRPVGAVAAAYRDLRRAVGTALHGRPAPCPAEPHVTLAGVGERAAVERLQELVAQWAKHVTPLRLEIERLSVFPAPFQTIIVQIRRTPELFDALSSLRRCVSDEGLHDLATVSPEEWIFHMSVAYCSKLPAAEWDEVVTAVETIPVSAAAEVVAAVEVVAFDDRQEYSGGVIDLRAATDAGSTDFTALSGLSADRT
jgi:2'-5' RNA ligase